jgi:hypothetical protein
MNKLRTSPGLRLGRFSWEAVLVGASNVSALRDPRKWRLRAEHIRNVADSVNEPLRRRSMLDIADQYERVGKFIEQQRLDLLKQPAAPLVSTLSSRAP